MSDLVGNPEDRFSCIAAHMMKEQIVASLEHNLFKVAIHVIISKKKLFNKGPQLFVFV